jgi:signal transduction histidine kinase
MHFDVRVDPDLPPVLVEEDGIRRSLHNLVGNAIKYAGDGRQVGLTVSRGTGADGGFVRMAVSDRGPGIPAEELPRIFEPFFRGQRAQDRQIRGNGLGLSLVKRIADAHGGRVTVTSTPGQGSTFTLYLPIATGVATTAGHPVGSSGLGEPAVDRGGQRG